MKLLEYQAKEIFKKYDIHTPDGDIAKSPTKARRIAKRLGTVAIKAQLPVGGRGKTGGIRFTDSPEEAEKIAQEMLGSRIQDMEIRTLLIEEKLDIKDEVYLGITIDRKNRSYVVLASSEGGVDIEEMAAKMPEKIVKHLIDPIYGLRDYQCRLVAKRLGYSGQEMNALAGVVKKLYNMAMETDAELTEINPLALTADGFIAADARLNIDNNALFRHPSLSGSQTESELLEYSDRERDARALGLTYVELDGNIGIIGNGAGLTMATLDTVTLHGGKPANFLDLGGGASPERIETAVTFVSQDPRVRVVFVNILGGITRCDDTARGIIETRKRLGSEKPVVVRMMGTNEEEGRLLLKKAGIETLDTMEEAADRAVALTGEYR